jgi:hypothetical protein
MTCLVVGTKPVMLLASTPNGATLLAQTETQIERSLEEGKTWTTASSLPQEANAMRTLEAIFVTADGTWIMQCSFAGTIGETGGYGSIFMAAPKAATWTKWVYAAVSGGGVYLDFWILHAIMVTTDAAGHPQAIWATARFSTRTDGPWLLQTALTGSPP